MSRAQILATPSRRVLPPGLSIVGGFLKSAGYQQESRVGTLPNANGELATGQNPVLSVNIPIPTTIDQNGWCTYPNMVPLVLTHSQLSLNVKTR